MENFQDLRSFFALKYFKTVFNFQNNFFAYFLIIWVLDEYHNEHIKKHFRKIYEEVKLIKLRTIIIKYKLNQGVKSHCYQLMVSGTQYAKGNMG